MILADLAELCTKRNYRRKKIKCKCDDCGIEFYSRLQTVFAKNIHYCKHCRIKGDRNYFFGKELPSSMKQKISNTLSENPPMLNKHHSRKVRELLSKIMIGKKHHLGFKNTPEQLKRMSDAANKSFANGIRAKTHGNALKGYFKNIVYGSSYEKYFLQYVDRLGLLDFIERGPTIEYLNTDGKISHYLSDFFIKKLNLVIEIKSDHFWYFNENNNILKMQATMKKYNYLLILNNDLIVLSYWLNKLTKKIKK